MSILDNVYNYYEKLVLEELAKQMEGQEPDEDFLTDAVCVALNHLPARYFRHGVDMAFYLSSDEFLKMQEEVVSAVGKAVTYVKEGHRD
ncbi:late competence development ComFB family protein [Hahella aquimaris]|uniref:late competence development ComFB family protein n=1 Tax=Hahella sp. HNIBRBA332 TaxID=3015983 RepID=UPI00273C7987|nr:late competence development ComFB family protein [Hahella sp. HNIBRBA332]WLQ11263.1 late competence development ComFB family protein [Hahella sp. HNIBRBA332]